MNTKKSFNHVGKRIGTWTVVEIVNPIGTKIYKFRCDCGNEKLVPSNQVYRNHACLKCTPKLTNEVHIGEKHGKVTCIDAIRTSKDRNGYLIRCDCGKVFEVQSYFQFLKMQTCKACSRGCYPGKKVGKLTYLEYVSNATWKMKCDCGNIFIGKTRREDCGCVYENKLMEMAKAKIGLTYESLTIKGIAGFKDKHLVLLIRCKCGKEFTRHNGHEFKQKSCGCSRSMPRGERCANATLKNKDVKSIRELHKSGFYSLAQLSQMYKKSENYLIRIINRHIWKHV